MTVRAWSVEGFPAAWPGQRSATPHGHRRCGNL